ncbi:hypothetical protein Tco_0585614 [Tanacetum coccineum]
MKTSDENSIADAESIDSQNFQLIETVIVLQEQIESFKAENEKIKLHYKELYDSIKITRSKHIEKTTSLQNEIENLKTHLIGKIPTVTSDDCKPKVAHQSYLNRLQDTLDTLRKIVEEDKIAKPLDNAVDYACTYTKRSQELLEYVIGTCPKAVNKRDKYIATTPVTKKKQVTFADPLETLNHNTSKQVKQLEVKKTNVPISPSTGVNSDTKASGSKPSSNIKNDRTLPVKSVPKKKVEDHIKTNKSDLNKKNRVDFSISYKRIVLNSNPNSLCKTCHIDRPVIFGLRLFTTYEGKSTMTSVHISSGLALQRKMIYQTQLNLIKPGWDAKGFEFKHDYTIIESPRAVVFSVNNNEQKIMRFNEIYKFSDGTLTRILEALDYRVKEFKIKQINPGMNT